MFERIAFRIVPAYSGHFSKLHHRFLLLDQQFFISDFQVKVVKNQDDKNYWLYF